ncbi:carboxymuconolactone decarboxylase family protein [Nocardia sp. CDC160]|uniref:carboxymuconolactone decarboxylase family protein n=1 Tax=Nocardia sp. CDC160 TaxID=3112166 RepID=UPI002DBDF462|nr:carboxymuconolactone decarboxylase family protein [Nocardia sp. CDC160]MEC3914861.1 carboxymuconolactone decarboxylase family protein [Nocardia sp. CDC160]
MTTNTEAYVLPTTRLAIDDLSPEIARAMNGLERAAQHTTLEAPLRELVKLRVAQINGCVYCVDMHSRDAVAGGETWRRISLLPVWRESPFFTPRERAAFALAESMTRLADSEVPDQIWTEAAAHFEEKELSDLVWHIAIINTWTRLGATARPWTLSGDANS